MGFKRIMLDVCSGKGTTQRYEILSTIQSNRDRLKQFLASSSRHVNSVKLLDVDSDKYPKILVEDKYGRHSLDYHKTFC